MRLFDDAHLTSDSPKAPSASLFTMDNEQPGVLVQYSELNGELGALLTDSYGLKIKDTHGPLSSKVRLYSILKELEIH